MVKRLGQDIQKFVNNCEAKFYKGVNNLGEDIRFNAVEAIKHTIATTPSGIVPGKPNRIDTGAMHENADAKLTSKGKSGAEIEYGWFGFSNSTNPGDYVKLQELGGGYVDFGMHSFHKVLNDSRVFLDLFAKGDYFE